MVMLMVYGGLMTIPQEPYESALMDGANKWQTFFKITLPLASSSILIAVLMRLIDVVKTYDIIYATTQGGPSFATETINIYGYLNMFMYYRFGKAAAISVLFFTETFGTQYGMGYFIMDAWLRINYLEMYSGIVVLSGMGLFLFGALDVAERYFCRWEK